MKDQPQNDALAAINTPEHCARATAIDSLVDAITMNAGAIGVIVIVFLIAVKSSSGKNIRPHFAPMADKTGVCRLCSA